MLILDVKKGYKDELYKTVKILELTCASEGYGVVKFCAMSYLRWAGCRVVFSYNSTYENLDYNTTGSTTIKLVIWFLTCSRWWRMMMKFRPLDPRTSYLHSNLGFPRILFSVFERL
jgi:hypothetical protein